MKEFYLVEVSYLNHSQERVTSYLHGSAFVSAAWAEKFASFDDAAGRLDWLAHTHVIPAQEARILHYEQRAAHVIKLHQ